MDRNTIEHLPSTHLETSGVFPTATPDQEDEARRSFISSLDSDAICALASQHNNGRPCRVLQINSGSFNTCFLVEFSQPPVVQWIVRIPIEPALPDSWSKLQSEVATLRFLEQNTGIKVPHVVAFGRHVKLSSSSTETQAFLITEYIPGEPLSRTRLLTAEKEHRQVFFSQLILTLAELRKLEFPSIGGLVLDANEMPQSTLGPVLSPSAVSASQSTLSSASKYMKRQSRITLDIFQAPVRDFVVDDIREEMFALHSMQNLFDGFTSSMSDNGPFVFNHLDLRAPNIIVNKELQIQGVIDWEFASTVPREVFTPPSWVTGHDSIEAGHQMRGEFRNVLEEMSAVNPSCALLRDEWYTNTSSSQQIDMALCIAHTTRRPYDTVAIYYDFLAPITLKEPVDDVIRTFFAANEHYEKEAQDRARLCARYTQHLKDRGLYETQEDKMLAKCEALNASLELRNRDLQDFLSRL